MFWLSKYFWVASSKVVVLGVWSTTGSAGAGDASAAGACVAGPCGAVTGVVLTAFASCSISFSYISLLRVSSGLLK